jgi:hypothetical protein
MIKKPRVFFCTINNWQDFSHQELSKFCSGFTPCRESELGFFTVPEDQRNNTELNYCIEMSGAREAFGVQPLTLYFTKEEERSNFLKELNEKGYILGDKSSIEQSVQEGSYKIAIPPNILDVRAMEFNYMNSMITRHRASLTTTSSPAQVIMQDALAQIFLATKKQGRRFFCTKAQFGEVEKCLQELGSKYLDDASHQDSKNHDSVLFTITGEKCNHPFVSFRIQRCGAKELFNESLVVASRQKDQMEAFLYELICEGYVVHFDIRTKLEELNGIYILTIPGAMLGITIMQNFFYLREKICQHDASLISAAIQRPAAKIIQFTLPSLCQKLSELGAKVTPLSPEKGSRLFAVKTQEQMPQELIIELKFPDKKTSELFWQKVCPKLSLSDQQGLQNCTHHRDGRSEVKFKLEAAPSEAAVETILSVAHQYNGEVLKNPFQPQEAIRHKS